METEALINQAIINHLGLWWTDDIKKQIKTEYSQEVLGEIEKISEYAVQGSMAWAENDDIEAYRIVVLDLQGEYTYLSKEAVIRIANMAAYYWK